MIKAGIIGGSNPMAGELIRLLIYHPDVEIIWVDSARFTGRLVSDVHHGLLGETQLRITPSSANLLSDISVLFVFRHKGQTLEWMSERELPDGLRIVDLSVDMRDPENAREHDFVYGLPELNRKAMVRGAKRAVLPHPAANIAELSLLPLAKGGALKSDISVEISSPAISEKIEDTAELAEEIARALRELAPDFGQRIGVSSQEAAQGRVMTAVTELESDLDIGEIIMMFEDFYDDHNFTLISQSPVSEKEVEGTNRCLINVEKFGDRLKITAMMDAAIKGAAGTAVHDMNLLFGLHEKVGLALKASVF
ncbi:MAG: hypothetical protein NC102_10765 [Clostridium sp.]|nr:hypothetical protein [Clostridium sp.]